MKRRSLFIAGLVLPLAAAARAQTSGPARVTLIDGGWQQDQRFAAIAVDLGVGWKTYWRVPGDAGIPPEFKWHNSRNLRAVEVLYPLPQRYDDQSGEAIGYKHRVVFPVRVVPADRAAPVELSLAMFLGVCSDICVPQRGTLALVLPPDGTDQGVAEWLAKVPRAATDPAPVAVARIDESAGAVSLALMLRHPLDDIFVEGAGDAYFHRPRFSGNMATIAVDNTSADGLRGAALKLTLVNGRQGVEQQISLP
jgi:DsbC/DsbD-like thiol-disulfide interchange protein